MIKVMQYGEGNFLRTFVDYYFDNLNEEGGEYGVNIVKPITFGTLERFEKQNNKYHVILRGSVNGKAVETVRKINVLQSVICPFTNYEKYIALAKDAELKIIVSNTTEAGICYNENDKFDGFENITYPAKLTKFLFERFSNGLDGVTCSALISICIGTIGHFGAEIGFIFILFTLNGFLQAGIYGCSIKLFNRYLSIDYYYKGIKLINGAQIIATAVSYGLSSLFVALGRWDIPFIIIGAIFLLSAIIFVLNIGKAVKNIKKYKGVREEKKQENAPKEKIKGSKFSKRYLYVYILIMCIISLLSNSAYYGINNWFSKLLYDVYAFPKTYSILVSVGINLILTVVSVLCIEICSKARNYYIYSIVGFVCAICFALLLTFMYHSNIVIAVILCLLFLLFNNWAKVPYASITAYKLRERIEPEKYTLILNAVVSVAAGVAPTVLSLMFESFGWGWSFISVAIMEVVLVCLVLSGLLIDKKLFTKVERDRNEGV